MGRALAPAPLASSARRLTTTNCERCSSSPRRRWPTSPARTRSRTSSWCAHSCGSVTRSFARSPSSPNFDTVHEVTLHELRIELTYLQDAIAEQFFPTCRSGVEHKCAEPRSPLRGARRRPRAVRVRAEARLASSKRQSATWDPTISVRSLGRPKWSIGLDALRATAMNNCFRQRWIPGVSVGVIAIRETK